MGRYLLLGSFLLVGLGCGRRDAEALPTLQRVTGIVTNGGKPVTGALVRFQPDADDASLTMNGTTDDQGKFEVNTLTVRGNIKAAGAPAGSYSVLVILPPDERQQAPPPVQLSGKYTVKTGENDFKVDIGGRR